VTDLLRRQPYDLDRLLAVAVGVFNERGYDGTSMEHLARAAGLSKSSIYHHVQGKEQLLRLSLERAVGGLLAALDEALAADLPAIARLELLLRRVVAVLAAELPHVTLLLRVRGNTPAERWALERRRDFDRRAAALVRRAAGEGDVRADVDPALVTRLVFGMINATVEWFRPERPDAGDGLADAVVALAMDGLRPRQARATRTVGSASLREKNVSGS